MKAEFENELRSILQAKDQVEEDEKRRIGILSDGDEEFTQQFQEVLKIKIVPLFEAVVEMLSRFYYPAEVRIVGRPSEKACYLTFSRKKASGNWALKGGEIRGPRMAFRAEKAQRNVAYFVDYDDETIPRKEIRLELSEITDGFLEEEIRRLFAPEPDQKATRDVRK